ncbi:SCP-2 sterol transfer family domain-containing protein [Ditylenchus destructor]|nr:SCP-2 sterol transfer family domain-containing protein [Ditylenchus destructor]
MDMLMQTPIDQFLTAMAASLNGPRADGVKLAVTFRFSDLNESYGLWIENAVLHHRKGAAPMAPAATLTLTKPAFLKLSSGLATPIELVMSGALKVDGDTGALRQFLGLLDKPAQGFPIVTR